MKMFLCLMMIVLAVFGAAGCGSVAIEDTNGADDFSLTTITDENIIKQDIGCSAYSSPAEEDAGIGKYKGNDFSGVAELYTINLIGKSDLTINVSTIQVDEGNFRLMVLQDDEIIYEFDLEEMDQTFALRDTNGTVSVKMAGESADFIFYMEIC